MGNYGRAIIWLWCAWCALPLGGKAEDVSSTEAFVTRLGAALDALLEQGVRLDSDVAYEAAVNAVLQTADPLGQVFTPAQEQALQRQREGRGYTVDISVAVSNEAVYVSRVGEVHEESVSDGLTVGDELLRINEEEVGKMSLFRIQSLLTHETPDTCVLVWKRGDGTVVTQHVPRVEQVLPDVASNEALPFRLAYLRVNRIREGTGALVADHIRQWADEERYGLILDLRGADGDHLDSVKDIGGLFAEDGRFLWAYRDADDQDVAVWQADNGGPLGMPVMVLVDGRTSGAAEVLASVLGDSVRGAMLFGQTTRGDLLLRERVALPDGMVLHLATRRLITADGTIYTGTAGVRPDVIAIRGDHEVEVHQPTRSGRTAVLDEEIEQEQLHYRVRNDAILRRAVDVLLGLKALDIRPGGTASPYSP